MWNFVVGLQPTDGATKDNINSKDSFPLDFIFTKTEYFLLKV